MHSNSFSPHKSKLSVFLFLIIVLVFALAITVHPAVGQQTRDESAASNQPKPIPISHLYGHFLMWQNVLDTQAAQRAAEGKSGDGLRTDLQLKLGFSDADYAPVRESSQRLSAKLKPLNNQIRAIAPDRFNAVSLRALKAQREANINEEVSKLQQGLSPKNKAAFEAFLVRFFAPKPISATFANSQSASQGVQR